MALSGARASSNWGAPLTCSARRPASTARLNPTEGLKFPENTRPVLRTADEDSRPRLASCQVAPAIPSTPRHSLSVRLPFVLLSVVVHHLLRNVCLVADGRSPSGLAVGTARPTLPASPGRAVGTGAAPYVARNRRLDDCLLYTSDAAD